MMHTYRTTYYEAYRTGEMVNLYPELVMVYNSKLPFKVIDSYDNGSSVLPNTLT
jgi:hypothetical protein